MSQPVIYNVTVSIDYEVHGDWLAWMKDIHIPDVMKTGFFTEFKFSRILAEEEGGMTYSIMYTAKSMAALNEYQAFHSPALQKEHNDKYGGKFAAFRTLLEIVDHG
ncbi:MAG: DUF4286 family protein [Flavobacteriales bacterium]|nr:DUF4286 family protein [Flavobacteriales bacterium]